MKKLFFILILLICVPVLASEKFHSWQSVDDMDDSTTNMVLMYATKGRNFLGERYQLVLASYNPGYQIFINWDTYIAQDVEYVTYRLDKNKTKTYGWSISNDGTTTYYPWPKNAPILLEKLKKAKKFIVKVTPYAESSIVAVFDVQGLGVYLDELKKKGKW